MISTRSAMTASSRRRGAGGMRWTMKATPTFSPRASALAAPKKLDATIRPRAMSSDHSTGALSVERSSTETMTTARSAARNKAAAPSVTRSSKPMKKRSAPLASDAPPDIVGASDVGRSDHVDDRLGVRMGLHELIGLRQDALAEGFLVAWADAHALLLENLERFLFHRQALRAGIHGGIVRGIEKAVPQLRVHAHEGHLAEIYGERREIVLREGVEFHRLVELAGKDGRRIVLQ